MFLKLQKLCVKTLRNWYYLQTLVLWIVTKTSYQFLYAARQPRANNLDVIGAVFEGSNAKRVVQKIFDEPHDCTGLHFIHRERKVAQSQLGSINLEERERNREKNKKKPSSGHQSKRLWTETGNYMRLHLHKRPSQLKD